MSRIAVPWGDEPVRVILADPGWQLADKLPGKHRGAAKNYRVLPLHEIMRFPLPTLDRDAILFLWRLSSMPQEALDVVRAWGFAPKSEIIWEKLTKTGKPWMGMGRYVRAAHETCLIATRGRFKVDSRSIRSRFSAKVPCDLDGRYTHSAKPAQFYAIVEELAKRGPYCELFARQRRGGWLSYGDELPPEGEPRAQP